LATPCRTTYGQPARSARRAIQLVATALAHSRSSTPKIAPVIASPSRSRPVRCTASAATLATTATLTSTVAQSIPRRRSASGSTSRRMACSGLTRRRPSRGRSAKTSATHTPTSTPMRRALGTSVTWTSTGRKSPRARGMSSWSPIPSSVPATAPTRPIAAACVR
jgi:hypothetical protein